MNNIKGNHDYSLVISPPTKLENQKLLNSCSYGDAHQLQKSLNEDLELSYFKIQPCDLNTVHNHKQCKFYHSMKDKRRAFRPYTSQLCQEAQKYIKDDNYDFQCPLKDDCQKCHNKVEQLYCLEKYKTKFCTTYPHNILHCQYGIYCSFAHKEDEIRMELIHHYNLDTDFFLFHYKTLWCPFNYLKHDRSQCVYAHNWQDYRRKPQVYDYQAIPCESWDSNSFITKYENECKNQTLCNKCHGWKQLQYHPFNYKTRQCSNGSKCPKGKNCPYYHEISQKRKFSQKIKSGFFIFYPRNRKVLDEIISFQDLKSRFIKDHSLKNTHDDSHSQSSQGDYQDEGYNELNQQIQSMVKKLIEQ